MVYFFDLDGTLLDSNGVWLDLDIDFLQSRGISPVPQEYTDYVTHHSFPEAAVYTREQFSLPESPEEIIAQWKRMAWGAYSTALDLKPGAKDLLRHLRARGERLFLLTSCMPELCQAALERHGLAGLLDGVLTTQGMGLDKKNPQLYRAAAEACGAAVETCLFFDDTPDYCQAARDAGMETVGVWDALFAHREEEMRELCHHYIMEWAEWNYGTWKTPVKLRIRRLSSE